MRYPTAITVPAEHTVMVYAQTASRDFRATIVPGTYPIEYTTVQYHPVDPEQVRPYFARIRVEILTPARTESSAEFAGVCYATREVPAGRQAHDVIPYAYEVEDQDSYAGMTLHY